MCYCDPNIRTPLCNNCHQYISDSIKQNEALKALIRDVAIPDLEALYAITSNHSM